MSSSVYQETVPPVTAKSLVVDLLSTIPARHRVPVGALVQAAALFGIGENSTRVTLARLCSRGLVESDQRGLYRLSRATLPVNRQVRSWASIEESVCSWDGSFVAVETSGLPRRDRREQRVRDRALRFLGFEALTPCLRIRPGNLVGGVDHCRLRLQSLGYSPTPVVFRLTDFDETIEQRARTLWSGYELESGYAATRERLAASALLLPSLPREDAMTESFRLGGEAMRQIVLDPLLPEEIVDVTARRAMIDEMRRYDRIGREAWKQWAGVSIELERSPFDIGGFETTQANSPAPRIA